MSPGGANRGRSEGSGRPKILEFISKNKDTTATLVAENLDLSAGQVNGIVSRLRKEGKVAKGTPLRVTQKAS